MDSHRQPAAWLSDSLQALAHADDAFAAWCQSVCPLEGNSEFSGRSLPQGGERENSRCDWERLSQRFIELLIHHSNWLVGAGDDHAAHLLAQTAALVLRLRTLENRFSTELEAKKNEAIYHFAYGLSHELNNPLANIATRAGVLSRDEDAPGRRDLLDTIVDSAMRGCEMLGDLMLIARPPQMVKEKIAAPGLVQAIVEKTAGWLKSRSARMEHRVRYDGWLMVDPVAMTEAIWCLIRNAIESMPDGGLVTFEIGPHFGPGGNRVRIQIADQGAGLSKEALRHCCDPYYSGREAGRGLGLGLSKAARIIELHDGELTISNRPGGGCSAIVDLPG